MEWENAYLSAWDEALAGLRDEECPEHVYNHYPSLPCVRAMKGSFSDP